MEVLHPSVMAGVAAYSSYRSDPLRRARNTLGYVLRTTFGSTPAATRVIESVKKVHARVEGARPDGVAYRALDPELIAWVHNCIPWAVMTAFDRYRRPLSEAEKNRYLAEQAPIGRMGGADWVQETVSELDAYVERMRPRLAGIRASMSLMPEWAQRLTGTHQPELVQSWWLAPTDRLKAKLVRWAYPELPCKALALARATGRSAARSAA
jgi:uncharacterized protein (DUF2236 family)